jgi:hypothetical protein
MEPPAPGPSIRWQNITNITNVTQLNQGKILRTTVVYGRYGNYRSLGR